MFLARRVAFYGLLCLIMAISGCVRVSFQRPPQQPSTSDTQQVLNSLVINPVSIKMRHKAFDGTRTFWETDCSPADNRCVNQYLDLTTKKLNDRIVVSLTAWRGANKSKPTTILINEFGSIYDINSLSAAHYSASGRSNVETLSGDNPFIKYKFSTYVTDFLSDELKPGNIAANHRSSDNGIVYSDLVYLGTTTYQGRRAAVFKEVIRDWKKEQLIQANFRFFEPYGVFIIEAATGFFCT